jgi:hypothetical protein
MITVYEGGDWAQLAVAKMLLQAEEIAFVTQGEGVQDLFGLGRVVGGFNQITGPVQLRVRPEDADRAREVLLELGDEPVDEGP